MHADIPKFRTFFVIFEQFFIHSFRKHKKSPSSYYKEGTHFHSFISTGTVPPIFVQLNRPEDPLPANISIKTVPPEAVLLQRKS